MSAGTLSAPLLMLALKVTLIIAASAALARAMRGASAATRHVIWGASLLGVCALSAAAVVGPTWKLEVLPARSVRSTVSSGEDVFEEIDPTLSSAGAPSGALESDRNGGRGGLVASADATGARLSTEEASAAASRMQSVDGAASRPRASLLMVLASLWLIGATVCLARLMIGVVSLRLVARRAQPAGPEWSWVLADELSAAGVSRRVRLLVSDAAVSPMTWGLRAPVVLLPAAASEWGDGKKRAVLSHEVAHVARLDSLTQLMASLATALHWYHPGVWWAARKLSQERERACDDRVLERGIDAREYATHLLDLARYASARGPFVLSAAMAQSTDLEGRVRAALDQKRRRGRAGGAAVMIAGGVVLIALGMGPLEAVERDRASDAAKTAATAQGLSSPSAAATTTNPGSGIDQPDQTTNVLSGTVDQTPQEAFSVRDSAGVRILESAAPMWAAGREWTLSADPIIKIGGPESLFQPAPVSSIRRARDGRWLLASRGDAILKYDPQGQRFSAQQIQEVNGNASTSFSEIYLLGDDSIGVYDATFQRLRILSLESGGGRVLDLGVNLPGGPAPIGVVGGHDIVFVVSPNTRPTQTGRYRIENPIVLSSLNDGTAHTLGTFPWNERFLVVDGDAGSLFASAPFFRSTLAAARGNEVLLAFTEINGFNSYDSSGKLIAITRQTTPLDSITDEDIAAWRTLARTDLARQTNPSTISRLSTRLATMTFPRTHPALAYTGPMLVDAVGDVWLPHRFPDGAAFASATEFSVYNPAGRWLGVVRVPDRFRVMDIGADYVAGVAIDEVGVPAGAGVQQVRVYKLTKP